MYSSSRFYSLYLCIIRTSLTVSSADWPESATWNGSFRFDKTSYFELVVWITLKFDMIAVCRPPCLEGASVIMDCDSFSTSCMPTLEHDEYEYQR